MARRSASTASRSSRRRGPSAVRAPALAAALLLAPAAHASPAQDYVLYCMGCHGADARGLPGHIPPLAGMLPLFMRSPGGRDYVLRVPGAANTALPDEQLTAVLNWLAESYPAEAGPAPAPFTVTEVAAARRRPLADVKETRRQVVEALAAGGAAPAASY